MSETNSWLTTEVLGFDTETTGIWTTRDRIATVSLIRRRGVGDAAEVDCASCVVVLDVVAYAVHEEFVHLSCISDSDEAVGEDIDGNDGEHGEDDHDPSALLSQFENT